MKALTVQQPWAWAIVDGGKNIENRSQLFTYRGPLIIHAGKQISTAGMRSHLIENALGTHGSTMPLGGFGPFGAAMGIVELVDVHPGESCCKPWGEESFTAKFEDGEIHRREVTHLVFERPRIFRDPIPCRGQLGLWTPEPHLQELIDLQILTSRPGVSA